MRLSRNNFMYTCSVCDRVGGRNAQEREMLDAVKSAVQGRAEQIVICVEFPLSENMRLDVVLVPCHATTVRHLIALELDGTDHGHKPRQYGMSQNEAFNAAAARDREKDRAVRATGMQFARIAKHKIVQVQQILDDMLDSSV